MKTKFQRNPRLGGELALIESIRRASASRRQGAVRLGIGDDCAILRCPAGQEILVTTDFCLEGRHFRRDWHTPESSGHRCLARGLSDLAGMGAKPLAAFLSLALPRGIGRAWVNGYFRGLRALADQFAVPLAGGDTAQSPSDQILADIVLVGSAPTGKALLRSTARPGDAIYVTGTLGGSAAELMALRKRPGTATKPKGNGAHPQTYPAPRLAVGTALLRRELASACIDISDGLSSDLRHICEASGVSAEIDLHSLPIHPLAAGQVELALHGGEDYELLFAARPEVKIPRSIAGVPVVKIGRFLNRKKPIMTLLDNRGLRTRLEAGGWEHQMD